MVSKPGEVLVIYGPVVESVLINDHDNENVLTSGNESFEGERKRLLQGHLNKDLALVRKPSLGK